MRVRERDLPQKRTTRRLRHVAPTGLCVADKLGFIGELTATHKLTMTTISVGTGVLDGPETMGVDVLYGDAKTI